jgi:hypothetical protein
MFPFRDSRVASKVKLHFNRMCPEMSSARASAGKGREKLEQKPPAKFPRNGSNVIHLTPPAARPCAPKNFNFRLHPASLLIHCSTNVFPCGSSPIAPLEAIFILDLLFTSRAPNEPIVSHSHALSAIKQPSPAFDSFSSSSSSLNSHFTTSDC